MKQKLDIDNWERRDHFNFFNKFDEPFWGVTVTIECTRAHQLAKEKKVSFYLYYLYKAITAAKQVLPFRYRIEEGEVFVYDHIDVGTTVPRSNGTFGFGYFPWQPDFELYYEGASKEMERIQNATDLERHPVNNIIRFSALPWLDFTSLSHARNFGVQDSAPKISFGKITEKDGVKTMPMSVHVHHALVDGVHVGQFVERFQALLNEETM
ncbi:chloramphenicol acetyltransferase [Deminuibacter soli]|uniref:Chloramphenicol acetyltransferase n=1 Tax=Deminuibacter soli TaxID=2291815 RepID=A0A3E1NMM2_9BACT|nr:chloramphenicol acetyltransferase [Deminuibacter soli]RFM29084.1 chloramphenicol acetyltransferase [Deminuibacter soli]